MQQAELFGSSAQPVLDAFLSKHAEMIEDLAHLPLEETGLSKSLEKYCLKLTHFDDLYDTLLYSQVIEQALAMNDSLVRVIDFGAGSSIPTLLALKESLHKAKVVAVDIDPMALEVSRENAKSVGLDSRYSYHLGSMQKFLQTEKIASDTLIVSNPPYIPTPQGINDYRLLPINGGEDGTQYILDFLKRDYPRHTTIALFWGSLCNPLAVVPAIEEKYEVLYTRAARVHFGHYTNMPPIKKHLYRLREEGKVSFENTDRGEVQIVLGTVLRSIS